MHTIVGMPPNVLTREELALINKAADLCFDSDTLLHIFLQFMLLNIL